MSLFKDLGCTNQSGEFTVPDCVKVGGSTATDIINSFIPTTLPYTVDGQISILGSSLPTTVSQENTQIEWRKYQAKAVNLSGYIDDEKNKPLVKRNTTNVIDSSKGDVLSFNGTGGIDLSTHSDYDFSNDCTIELYVKFNSYAPVGDTSPVNIIGTTGPNGWTTGEWGLNFGTQNWNTSKTNRLLLWVYSGVNTPKLYSSYALSLNTWYHIALVQSGNNINLFINGVLDATATGKLTMNNIAGLTSFGRLNGYVYKLHITKFAKYDRDFIPDDIISDSNTIFHLKKIHSGKLFINNKEQTVLSTTKNKPDFFGDGSNVATYLFSTDILPTKYIIDKAIFEAPKSSGNYTFFGSLQFWYNNQPIDIKAYLVDRNNARLELDGVVIGNLNQDNVWYTDNGKGDWNPNNIIKSSINNGWGTTNNTTKQTITLIFSKDIKIDNISYVSYLSGLPGGSNITTTLSYKGTQLFTHTDITQYSTTRTIIPTILDANGIYNGVGTNITYGYGLGRFDNCISSSISSQVNCGIPHGSSTTVTISGWVKWNGIDLQMPFGFNCYSLLFWNGNFGFNSANADLFGITSTGFNNVWKHIVVQFNTGSYGAIWVDGIKQTLTQKTGSIIVANTKVANLNFNIFGWSWDTQFRNFGSVDNIRIFNRVLTDAEVVKLYEEDTTTFAIEYGRDRTLTSSVQGTVDKVTIDTWVK